MKDKLILLIVFTQILVNWAIAQDIGTGISNHSIVKRFDGKLFTWGWNYFGQLGNGQNTNKNNPVLVDTNGVLSGKTIITVAVGAAHNLALSSDGMVYSWGANLYGGLGIGNNIDINVPVAVYTGGVLSGKSIIKISAGSGYSIVVASDGTVYTWGQNTYGELGNGTSGSNAWKNVPVVVDMNGVLSGKNITEVAGGQNHSIALASDGTVYTWGNNSFGQLGDGSNINSSVPVAVNTSGVLSGKTVIQVAAGYYHSLALTSDGNTYSWGRNDYGQLGNGNTGTNRNLPVAVSTSGLLNGKTITKIAAGAFHNLVLTSDGELYTWGFNEYGQLGNGNTGTNSNIPVAVSTSGVMNGKSITQLGTGFDHCLAIASDGTLFSWGNNTYGELGNGNNTHSNVPVQVNQSVIGLLPVDELSPTLFSYELSQNYPNPFNPITNIRFTLPHRDYITLKVYDILGTLVEILLNGELNEGEHTVTFNAKDLTTGIYFYQMKTKEYLETKKMILMK
ncbi:MAG: T9SS type A sorting domain-containing protein [Ignavibacteriaceae bacterium]|nr:T9SS type A sorting domain-containing protein [Ignavibacteriaceae bacterium]